MHLYRIHTSILKNFSSYIVLLRMWVNFLHPGYCVCPNRWHVQLFYWIARHKKNSEGLEQNSHLHSNILSFTHASHVIQPLNADTRFQIDKKPPTWVKRNVGLPCPCQPWSIQPKTWFLRVLNLGRKHSVAQVLQNDRESLGAAFDMLGKNSATVIKLGKAWVTFGCPLYTPSLLLLTSKLALGNTTVICLESDMLQAQSPRLSGWPFSFADCSMLQQRPQPQTGSHPEPLAIPGNGNKSKT